MATLIYSVITNYELDGSNRRVRGFLVLEAIAEGIIFGLLITYFFG